MLDHYRRFLLMIAMTLVGLNITGSRPSSAPMSTQATAAGDSAPGLSWQSHARLRHGLKATRGNLIVSGDGIEFRSEEERFSHRWLFSDVETFDLTSRHLVITDYENRHHHLPGERRFRFDLDNSLPPPVAAQLAERVGKPARNGDPGSHGAEPGHHPRPPRNSFWGHHWDAALPTTVSTTWRQAERGAGVGDGPTSRPLPVLILITSASAATARPSHSNSSSLCHRSFLTGYGTAFMGAI